MTTTVSKISEIKSVGMYSFNGVTLDVTEVTKVGKKTKYRGECTLADGTKFTYYHSASTLGKRIENNGKLPKRDNTTTGAGSFEKTFLKLQQAMLAAEEAFATFQYDNNIFSVEDAQEADKKTATKKAVAKKQAARRTTEALLKRITMLRRWAKESNRLMLFQQLTDKLLEITE